MKYILIIQLRRPGNHRNNYNRVENRMH